MLGRIKKKQHDYLYLEARIDMCKFPEDTYVVFSEIQDYLCVYNVSNIMYRKLFEKCMDKYNEIK